MVVEYLLLLVISITILGGAFGFGPGGKGPVEMLKKNVPYLANKIERNLETGAEFKPVGKTWDSPP